MTRTVRSPAPAVDPVAAAVQAVDALLRAVEASGTTGPAATAYRAAIRRHGEILAREGGSPTVRRAFDELCGRAPGPAEGRSAFLADAWSGLHLISICR